MRTTTKKPARKRPNKHHEATGTMLIRLGKRMEDAADDFDGADALHRLGGECIEEGVNIYLKSSREQNGRNLLQEYAPWKLAKSFKVEVIAEQFVSLGLECLRRSNCAPDEVSRH